MLCMYIGGAVNMLDIPGEGNRVFKEFKASLEKKSDGLESLSIGPIKSCVILINGINLYLSRLLLRECIKRTNGFCKTYRVILHKVGIEIISKICFFHLSFSSS